MRLLSSVALCALLAMAPRRAAAEPTAAELETATALYKEGKALRTAGHLAEALDKLREAHRLGQTPVTGIELARTHVMLGHLVKAREVALEVVRIPIAADETERSAAARADAAALSDDLKVRIPSIEVHAEGAVAVSVDGALVLAPTEPHPVDPGTHVVGARTAVGRSARATVVVAERESRIVTLSFPAAPAPPEAAPLAPDGFVFGAAFVVAPHLYFPATSNPPAYVPVVEVMAGASVEAGAALTPRFEILARAFATLGDRGKPSYAVAAGPAFSYRVADRVWLGGGLAAGRADTTFEGLPYSTDWVITAQGEASFALLTTAYGEWLVSAMPGYFFANQRADNPDLFMNISFGYRSF